jgi:hypothetical protein
MSSVFTVKKKRLDPDTLLYSGRPKIGKSTMLSKLSNNLIISLEKNGCDYLDIPVIDCSKILSASAKDIIELLTSDTETKALDLAEIINPADKHKALNLILRALVKLGRPYKYVSIDTITQADLEAEWAGTENYMESLQGKTFNRQKIDGQPSTQWPRLAYGHPEYQSVIEGLGQNGWRWSRSVMIDLLNLSRQASLKCTIYVCHIKDKLMAKGDKGEVFVKDIALTGAVSDIYARNVSAIASVFRDEEQLMISFKGNEEKTGGSRGAVGSYEGEFSWGKIFSEV